VVAWRRIFGHVWILQVLFHSATCAFKRLRERLFGLSCSVAVDVVVLLQRADGARRKF
jgi:hypothetical protein